MKANNADDYAASRLNIFFEGRPRTLDGQCACVTKWFMEEMTSVPNPQAARGNAKDIGDTLMRQGLAIWIQNPKDRKRGDLVIWKDDGGGFGHIGLLLSGDRVLEQNVGLEGTPSKQVRQDDGSYVTVYASRIDPLYANWRKGNPTFYRIGSYKEKSGEEMTRAEAEDMRNVLRVLNSEVKGWDRKKVHTGEYDKKEVDYLMGLASKPSLAIARYSQQAWDEGTQFRLKNDKVKTDLDAANKRIKELEAAGAGQFVEIFNGKVFRQK